MITETDSDARLLERFARRREEAAFRELVERHGPRVLRICRRLLPCEHDAQDAFQATFLTLARKAGRVSWTGSAGPWLAAVARRLAMHARGGLSRRHARERTISSLPGGGDARPDQAALSTAPEDHLERAELRKILDDALGELPDKYREPIVLCYLEGMTNDEAARRLGWPTGSMSRRLERARALLRKRLVHSGVLASLLAAGIAWRVGPADGPAAEGRALLRPAMHSLAGIRGIGRREPAIAAWVAGVRGEPPTGEQIETLARNVEEVALVASAQSPGLPPGRVLWRGLAAGMFTEARSLAEAGRAGDRASAVEAARRLESTCVSCHMAFRR
ncbi:sigma-70 family RNA polymerase sigma factor [Aquisphaera giovannonii]|uniref:sigma-70 family RNA polymerase sigma factor n=1 Tax=Aquisphaera giovannonii TaxID=406548 RepID=UPI001FE53CDC|nr:sigma-70 family RNA polymerase sigma factor [Aquisphaera giovannonii]